MTESPVFVIRPNSSLSWRGNLLSLAFLAAICFAIAGSFAWIGLWMILPFAGLEVTLLAAALYLCAKRAQHCEVVRITDRHVEVEVGRGRPEVRQEFVRCWVQVVLKPATARNHSSQLVLRSHGKDFEIGACLPEDERRELAQALRLSIQARPDDVLRSGAAAD